MNTQYCRDVEKKKKRSHRNLTIYFRIRIHTYIFITPLLEFENIFTLTHENADICQNCCKR